MQFASILSGKKKFIAIFVLAVFAFIVFCLVKTVFGEKKIEMVLVPPSLAQVQQGNMDQRVSASGTTMAADEYSIFIELSQEVKDVFAEVGDTVTEGQLLVTYDIDDQKKELENKLKTAQITLDNAQISLSEIAAPATGAELLELESAIVTAKKNIQDANNEIATYTRTVKDAQKTVEENKELLAVGAITQKEYDDSETALEEAEQNKESKELSLESLELTLQKAELNLENGKNKLNDLSTANSYKKQQNTVVTAQMDIEALQEDLSKLTEATYSPISGTIIESNAVEGQMLTDSTVMMKVADLTNIDVTAYVSEYDIAKIQVGQKVEMTSDGIENKIYTGTVTKIEPVAESQSTISGSETVVPIKVHMEDNDELVKPGFSFDLEIIVVDLDDVSYIPVSAVMKDKQTGETYVYTVDDSQTLKKTVIGLGTYSDMSVELLNGLTAQDQFVESPTDAMQEGMALMDFATSKTVSGSGNATGNSGNSLLNGLTGGAAQQGGGMRQGGGMPPSGGGRP